MDTDNIEATYKRANRSGYPELDGYAWADIYRDVMGPSGLFLAVQMARTMNLRPKVLHDIAHDVDPQNRADHRADRVWSQPQPPPDPVQDCSAETRRPLP